MNRVTITRPAYERLIQICLDKFPDEACGVLASYDKASSLTSEAAANQTVSEIIAVRNAAGTRVNSYTFDPTDWVAALYKIQRNRQTIAGFFHSHPTTPAAPSASDIEQWSGGTQTYAWIISLAKPGNPVIKAYRPQYSSAGELMFTEVSIHII
ncbi:Mov34/MPN/PAD-1 family protein [Paenibacillus tarimensis]|uniref:Mov34/MPN/PAD-1 family protein n=1 Tax=Paenibacillus tarimensis TaxID=416012 RepID=UPI001F2A9191|nr:M67 family metallopeptidase [Paenibacillus tarimensis]MCF2943236.1 M67 family metallopeptidase [Paenibacillus tarimensis]